MSAVRSLSVLVGAIALSACGSGSHPEAPREVLGADSSAVLLRAEYSGFTKAERLVVRSSVQWADVWATAFAQQTPVAALPDVDFSTEAVIVAASGTRPSGGYHIAIESVTQETGGIGVVVRTTSPGGSCVTTAALTQPVIMLRVDASAGPIRFHERSVTHACN
jgi:PrcB C-terminal